MHKIGAIHIDKRGIDVTLSLSGIRVRDFSFIDSNYRRFVQRQSIVEEVCHG